MRKLIMLVAVALTCGGCSLLSFERTAPPPMPEPIKPAPSLQEMEVAAYAWEGKALEEVEASGAPARAPLVQQAIEVHKAAHLRFPAPTRPWPEPKTVAERVPEVDAKLRKLQALQAEHRQREYAWRERYERLRGMPVKSGWRVASSALGWVFWLLVGAAGLSVIGIPALPVLVGTLRRVWRAFRQTVQGIEDWKHARPYAEVQELKDRLARRQDEASKQLVEKARK